MTGYPRPNPKRVQYRLSDPYLAFWHRFVADVKGRGLASLVAPDALWDRAVEPRLDEAHVAGVFEDACRQWVARGGAGPSPLPFRPVQVGSWWTGDGGEEVDVVALDGAGGLLCGRVHVGAGRRAGTSTRCSGGGRSWLRRRGASSAWCPCCSRGAGSTSGRRRGSRRGRPRHVPVEALFGERGR